MSDSAGFTLGLLKIPVGDVAVAARFYETQLGVAPLFVADE